MFKKIILAIGAVALYAGAEAQNWNIGERAKQKVLNRVDRGIDEAIDKGLSKTEEEIKEGAKKEGSKETEKPDAETQKSKGSTNETSTSNEKTTGTKDAEKSETPNASLKVYSKFDFVQGDKVVAVEDFSQDEIGDFPARWNTNASGETVKLSTKEGKWLLIPSNGLYYPEFFPILPENFTLEMDLISGEELSNNMSGLIFMFVQSQKNMLNFENKGKVSFTLHPGENNGYSFFEALDQEENQKSSNEKYDFPFNSIDKRNAKLSIWRQKNRLRVYVNEVKIWDIPRAFENGIDYRFLLESSFFGKTEAYISNLRLAVGAPDTRNKLITEGKFSTTGILFDVNSDKIKPQSYGVLKEIATALNENPDIKVKIIGHTDADGNAQSNLELSKKRAASVKQALMSEFGISASRLETDGKGASEPVAPNTTTEGKANNRRVEFVKL